MLGECEGVRFLTVITSDDVGGYSFDHALVVVEAEMGRALAPEPDEVRLELGRSAESWRDDVVAAARSTIAGSELEKAVFARSITLSGSTDFEPARIIERLAERFATALLFSIDNFIGASPELLVSRRDRTVRAHPLAGTCLLYTSDAADE